MKIGLQTWGTEGDVRPFMALATGLQAAGHQVTLLTTEIRNRDFSAEARRLRIAIRKIGHIECGEEQFKELVHQVFYEKNPAKQGLILLKNFFYPAVADMLAAAELLCAENDAVIGHFFVWPLKIAALKSGRPFIAIHTTPIIPSCHLSPQGLPNLGRWWNWLWWQVMDLVLNKMWKPPIDAVFRAEGIEPGKSLMKNVWRSALLNLVSVSPSLFPAPPDWPGHFHLCGFFGFPQQDGAGGVAGGLKEFLSAGEPPVYMTFGSMLESDPDPRMITRLMIDSARMAGVRAIIQSNWNEIEGIPEHPSIFRTVRASHRSIFPHCAVVVHHGGAGTTQAAIEAGCPSVVVAHASDQPLWGAVLKKRGAAPKFLLRRSVTPQKLAGAIRIARKSAEMKDTAKKIGRQMRAENGVLQAVRLIESVCSGKKSQ